MLVVTTETVAGHRVVETKGQCFGVVVRSRGLGGNIMAGLRSIVGGEINEYTQLLEEARRHAVDRLVHERDDDGRQRHPDDALRFRRDRPDDERDRRLRNGGGDRAPARMKYGGLLRAAVLGLGAALIGGGLLLIHAGCGLGAGLRLAVPGLLLIAAIIGERWRYRRLQSPGPAPNGWPPTSASSIPRAAGWSRSSIESRLASAATSAASAPAAPPRSQPR